MDVIVCEKGVIYVMIYDFWFEGQVLISWCKIGELIVLSVFVGYDIVLIYLIDFDVEVELIVVLVEFSIIVFVEMQVVIFGCVIYVMDS